MTFTSSSGSPRVEAALAYATRGWRVHPLYGVKDGKCACARGDCTGNSRGKHPILAEWQKNATADAATIRKWWGEWPDVNIGIATGRVSGIVVLDIDRKPESEESLTRLEKEFGKLPDTVESITGSGGRHVLFAYPTGVAHIPNAAPLPGYPGIDLRADGGYIVAPPSGHHSGNSYEWELSSHPDKVPLARLPELLLRLVVRPERAQSPKGANEPGWVTKALAGATEGERDKTCIKLAGYFNHKGIDANAALTILADWASKCSPPFPEQEVAKCVKSAYRYPSDETGTRPSAAAVFKLTSIADLMAEPEEVTSWLWDRALPTGGLSLVSAKPKVGKSTWARNLALKVAKGESFLGRNTTRGTVVYLALEEKRTEVAAHFARMGAIDEPILIHTGSVPDEALTGLANAIAETKASLAIVDPLFRLVRIHDANDYIQVNRALEPLLMLARSTNCHILAVHHMGKGEREGGDAILGSTALFAGVDTALFVRKHEAARTIESIQRYGDDIPRTALSFDPESGIIEATGSVEELELDRVKGSILELASEAPMTEKEIREEIGGNTGIAGKALRQLVAEGRIEREGSGKRGDPFTYRKLVSCFSPIDKQQKREKPGIDATEPCFACGSSERWQTTDGRLLCRRCHPPP